MLVQHRWQFNAWFVGAAALAVVCIGGTDISPRFAWADPPVEQINVVDELDKDGFSQLHRAALGGDVARANQLIAAGANVDVRQGKYFGTPLQYAAHHGHREVVEVLLKNKARVDFRDAHGRTPLIWAATGGRTKVIHQLLDAGADIEAANSGGWTALHYAMQGKHTEAAEALIARGANKAARNSEGHIPRDLQDEISLDDANLKQLVADIQSTLPPGWQVATTPDIPRGVTYPGQSHRPIVAIWRTEKAEGRWHFPNPGGEEDPFEPEQVCFTLELVEHMPPELYQQAVQENARRNSRRLAMMKSLPRGIRFAWMGPVPIPPDAYEPQTPEETDAVRRYALVWLRTEPRPLATHTYRTLSFVANLQETLELKNPEIRGEREVVLNQLLKCIQKRPDAQ